MIGLSSLKILAGVAVIAALGWAVVQIRKDAADGAIRAIERVNDKATGGAEDFRARFDECVRTGGVFDFATADCRRP